MKYLLALAIMALCNSETYYSLKEYQVVYNMLDTPFNSYQSQIVNQEDLIIHLNALGTIDHPKMIDNVTLANNQSVSYINTNQASPRYFSISFNQPIIIEDMSFIINGYANNQSLTKSVYINQRVNNESGQTLFSGGRLLYRGNNETAIKLSSSEYVTNIIIRFDDIKVGDKVSLTYFKIDKYQILKHSKWVKDYIGDTETKTINNCLESNSFTPNGTNGYVFDALSIFNASRQLNNDYKPILKSTQTQADYLRGNNTYPYSTPDLSKLDQYAPKIAGYQTHGLANTPSMYFTSYGAESTYIKTGAFGGLMYYVYPIYWTQTKGLNNYIYTSYDANWCYHTTDSYDTPCFKYQGHSNNNRLNSYDIKVNNYENVVMDDDITFKDSKYYIYDVSNNAQNLIAETQQLEQRFHLNQTGIYRLIAILHDAFDNQMTVESNNFYIDQLPPTISYQPHSSNWTNQKLAINIHVSDADSGVKKVTNKLNGDIISGNNITLTKEGIYQLETMAYDFVDNSSKQQSGYYKIDLTKPIIEANEHVLRNDLKLNFNIYDELSGLSHCSYQINYDDAYGPINNFDCKQLNVEIKGKTSLTIKAYDLAGNMQEFNKTYFEVIDLKHKALFTRSYQINQASILYINLKHDKNINIDVQVYQDNYRVYQNKHVVNGDKTLEIPFMPVNNQTDFKVLLVQENNQESLNLKAESINYQSSDDLEFEGITGYYVDAHQSQNYHEYLVLKPNYFKTEYYQGQGLEISYQSQYINQCAIFEGFVCRPSNRLDNFDIKLLIDNGRLPQYLNHGNYQVSFKMINDLIILPDVYVERKNAAISAVSKDNYIDGKNRWYLDFNLPKGDYNFKVKGHNIAHNQFNFDKLYHYQMTKQLKELYYARFIDPNNINLKDGSIHSRETIEQLR